MKRWILLTLIAASCGEEKTVPFEECGRVVDTIYTPPSHGSGVGISGKGGVHYTSINVDPVWGVVFACTHGQFVVQGSDDEHEKLWKALPKGSTVRIHSNSRLWSKDDGKTWALTGYDFIDAKIDPTCLITEAP
jgi:hypothetical protein